MKRLVLLGATLVLLYAVAAVPAYVEVPYSLGQVIRESSHIVLVEVSKVDKTKNLIIFKKLSDLKGKHPTDIVKHNIGKGGFHPREWQNIMAWAEEGQKAVFFHNGGASETCIGTYWYQAYAQGEWWGMSHAEPFLLRTYCGDAEKLAQAVTAILKGEEVVVPCMVDGNKELLHQRKAKLQLVKASLKRANYDPKRDFVSFGGDGTIDIPEYKTTVLLAESAEGWRFLPAAQAAATGDRWKQVDFDDAAWRTGKAPIGYGEAELQNRKGTVITEVGQAFCFRRTVEISAAVLDQKGVQIKLSVASDNSADVWINGQPVSMEGEIDHEFAYWNTEVELKPSQLRPGKNVITALVRNGAGSSDLFFDLELAAQVPLPRKVNPAAVAQKVNPQVVAKLLAKEASATTGLTIDKGQKTVAVDCLIAPRKLPHLDKTYPIEVIACFPHPKGQKAHETIVVFDKVKPIQVHKALAELGLTSGNPARGEGAQAEGPEVKLFLEFTAANGQKQKLPIEQLLVDTKNGNKPIPAVKWHFTGSALKQPNPEKDEQFYAANLTGTLISVFPVTDETVFQSHLTLKEEANMKLEIAPNILPKEGSTARLIIQVP